MTEPAIIYIVDQVTPKLGREQEFYKLYMEDYVPGTKARGWALERTLLSPPMWLKNQTNTFHFVWSVKGVQGFWAYQMKARTDPSLPDWWRSAEHLIESRKREYFADVADVAGLANV